MAFVALQEKSSIVKTLRNTRLRKTEEAAVRVSLPAAFEGYTLHTVYDAGMALMVDMQGREVHRWRLRKKDRPSEHVSWFDAHLFADGSLLVVEHDETRSPCGMGVRKLDRDSNTLWYAALPAHHVVNIADDGRIAVLLEEVIQSRPLLGEGYPLPKLLDDQVGILSAQGTLLQKVSLTRLLLKAGHKDLLLQHKEKAWDPVHSNSAMILDATLAPFFPMFREGSLLVSLRRLDAVAVVDMEQRSVTLLSPGFSRGQHDAKFMADGTMLVFDNFGTAPIRAGGVVNRQQKGVVANSRIVSYDPVSKASRILYGDRPGEMFYSAQRGTVSLLPNGNLLITESDNGRVFEVDGSRNVVWDYLNPLRTQEGLRAGISVSRRYAAEYPRFLQP